MAQDELKAKALAESDVSSDGSDWEDAEPEEEETLAYISLLDDAVFPDLTAMLQHCREKHNFDFIAIRRRLGLDFFGTVKLVNFGEFNLQGDAYSSPNRQSSDETRNKILTRSHSSPTYS